MSDQNDFEGEDDTEDTTEEGTAEEASAEAQPVIGTVVPLHAATAGSGRNKPHVVTRGRGRPKKVIPKPTTDDLLYHAEMLRRKTAFIDADALVQSTRNRQEAIEVLNRVKEEVAREAASLHFARMEEEKYGKDTSQMSSRRIQALREVAALELEIKKLGVTMIDVRSERFQKIFKFFFQTVLETAGEVLQPEQFNVLSNRLETTFEGWEEKAQDLAR